MIDHTALAHNPGERRWRFQIPGLTPEQAFAIAADIERYPEFVVGCTATRILRRDGNVLVVDNVFSLGFVKHRFITRASLIPPHNLSILADPDPLLDFSMYWTFAPTDDGVDVQVRILLRLHARLLKLLPAALFTRLQGSVIDAFEKRARAASH